MLIVFAGLPGVGKTAIARELALSISALYIRIDTIEQAIRECFDDPDVGPAGYIVAYAVASENLALGHTVVADEVNPIKITRDAWIDVAKKANVPIFEIEVICSDMSEHRRRVESRTTDVPGLELPTWQDVLDREYHSWDRERIVIDTAERSIEEAVKAICGRLSTLTYRA